ncbi:RNA polymerase sigma factor [Aporhodopirellula aestuarii]|uniref:Sigma-70 family RNA polymerase sigma factor n=1 Tax=Aporhodopirellula aestuarii TaxID=2950107 RepID=A0ABT0U2A1_9BACT|nr:sigma-70 family RNA polymerase sigma factor [Aporhodopirellula aestuarii]MCM2371026.1 sigma-70 family RNA polymerase sigma factor [Aporhodopirellula aestuarii]
MTESPLTRATLLLRLRDPGDSDAWGDFLRDYGPMIYRFVRSRGLQDADAADVVQDVLRSVGNAIDRFDYAKEKGGFRAWLFTITRNKLATYFEKRKRTSPTANDTTQFELLKQATGGKNELDERWELEHQRLVAAKAMEILKPTIEPNTWKAFELTAIDGLAAEEAGASLGMSKGAVYVARSRVTAKLRDEVTRILAEEDVVGELR